ncbi:bifunctional protein PyrR [Clostridium pasteurianum DSM 525 = ATCC 6013]|uniref:Bifunctional protein PyrR n=1 Tax=Clostridium pasteurianum DSM 525 = ATCC 6013 TaxID=1262449 RepID=A0A0H3J202_CLOPA|nr:bifunctional pyr operon transcriptional regulator/uracil phosphoribosyltransferase PyrR [Clostridium pasteurianum]AJA47941.1 bifunctional protein PyrR [Clostridium pasteurianum DSM 525 = ATCC 6013]AJA51929.1 bifunctional protein PyrR [Clostridium pasteurianum DSM 525 = ATCC 6013]AOZ75228.1 transcriptional regulator [Clostridium pasteurianum DSM 525 = ATCC 6013]AOZ79023.1 transcriptional regulator [Clostridium pasteurianum]ELP59844.1 bifunctional pyrimidine regulatory protein PyrR uracil pho
MKLKAVLLDEKSIKRTLTRISHEIIEKNKGTEDMVLIGIKRRGVPLAERIAKIIESIEGNTIPVASVDIALYRDDLKDSNDNENIVNTEELEIDIKNKKVILVDDVLHTGRSARAAIDAIIDCGRPKMIQLAALIDRGHRELPIRADYVGKNVPTSNSEVIAVRVSELDDNDSVGIYEL